MRYIPIALCIVLLSVLAGCKGGKELATGQSVPQEIRNDFENLVASYPQWSTFSSKGSADLALGQGGSLSASTQVRMVCGESLQISVRIFLGIEVARLYMTRDSLFLVDKMQRRYMAESLADIGNQLSQTLSLATVQDALLGRIFLLDTTSGQYHIDDFEVVASGSSRWSLLPRRQDARFGYRFDLNGTKLLSTKCTSADGRKSVVCHYADFIRQGQSDNFPTSMQLALTGLSLPLSLNLHYDASSVAWNGSVSVEKPNFSRYTRVTATQLLKELSL